MIVINYLHKLEKKGKKKLKNFKIKREKKEKTITWPDSLSFHGGLCYKQSSEEAGSL